MENIISAIKKSLENENWYSALVMSLIVPDICSKLAANKSKSRKRYSDWFNKYLGEDYKGFLSGDDCFALRCSFLHEGTGNTEEQNAQDILHQIHFISKGMNRTKLSGCSFGDPKTDGKELLILSTLNFCQDIIDAGEQWLIDVKDDKGIQARLDGLLVIGENGFSIGKSVRIN